MFMSDDYGHQLGQDPNLASSRIDMGEKIDWSIDMGNTYLVLSQTVIFSIKASFLSFFRRLIDRLGRIIIYWKVTVTVTVIAFFFCASQAFISCPETGLNQSKYSRNRWYHDLVLTQPCSHLFLEGENKSPDHSKLSSLVIAEHWN